MLAIFIKEFQQMLRDRLTFAMAVGVPVLQLVLFGYAINTDPKGLPTAVVSADAGPLARSLIAAVQQHRLFPDHPVTASEAEAEALLETGEVQFMLVIPSGLLAPRWCAANARRMLVSADATDPAAAGNALAALAQIGPQSLGADLRGPAARICRARRQPSSGASTGATTPRGCRATTSSRA